MVRTSGGGFRSSEPHGYAHEETHGFTIESGGAFGLMIHENPLFLAVNRAHLSQTNFHNYWLSQCVPQIIGRNKLPHTRISGYDRSSKRIAMKSPEKSARELMVDMFVSLDGFAAGADGTQNCFRPYFGPQSGNFIQRILDQPHVMIVGRVTYQLLSKEWRSASGPGANRMNALPKVVFSNSLDEPLDWNNSRLAKRKLADQILALKSEPGDPLRSVGSIDLVKQMMQLGLVDRLRLLVFPIVLGSNGHEPLFSGYGETGLKLVDTAVFDSKVLKLEYRT